MSNESTQALHQELIHQGKTLALAESCTGGAIAAQIVSIPGASQFFLGSFVVYVNEWKEKFLGVTRASLEQFGAESAEVVKEMVQGLFDRTDADYAMAVSGIAGPTGGTPRTPVGTIHFAIAKRGKPILTKKIQAPQERRQAIAYAVQISLDTLRQYVSAS